MTNFTKTNISNKLKEKFVTIINFIDEKKIDFEFKDKLDIRFFIVENFGEDGAKLSCKALKHSNGYKATDHDKEYQELLKNRHKYKTGVFRNSTIPNMSKILKNYEIDVNDFGIEYDFDLDKKNQELQPEETFKTDTTATKEIKLTKLLTNIYEIAENYLNKKYDFKYNIVSLEFGIKLKNENKYKPLNENNLFIELQKANIKLSINNLVALLKSDFIKPYDPFNSYFENLQKWDGKDHILSLTSYIKATNQEQFNIHFKKWLVRVVATALNENYFNKQAFILVQEKQNSGKSTFCRFLCPPELSDYIAEDITTDKDSRILMVKNLLINLDELSTLSKKDVNQLKSLFSKDKINERLPYDKKNSILSRRCSFLGSTNQTNFLTDETGSVRWLCFEIEGIDWDYKKQIDINKVYSQAYQLYKSGKFKYDMTAEEIRDAELRNKSFEILTFERELIEMYYKPTNKREDKYFRTAGQITVGLKQIIEIPINIYYSNIGKALTMLGYYSEKHSKFGRKGYYIEDK